MNSCESSIDSRFGVCVYSASQVRGAVAQLGERLNGIQEVEGSIPFGSTIDFLPLIRRPRRHRQRLKGSETGSSIRFSGAFPISAQAPKTPILESRPKPASGS